MQPQLLETFAFGFVQHMISQGIPLQSRLSMAYLRHAELGIEQWAPSDMAVMVS